MAEKAELSSEQAEIVSNIEEKLAYAFGKTLEDASTTQIYKAVGMCVRDGIMEKWIESKKNIEKQNLKQLYYLSVEFLMGRALDNNLINTLLHEDYAGALSAIGFNLWDIEQVERDPGLGNGGLGRLAACFLDSLSTLRLPAMGCGIRYEYGLFQQKIVEGMQIELPDDWLADGNLWEIEVPEESVEVHFGGEVYEEWVDGKLKIKHMDYRKVIAVPYDMPIAGYDSDVVNTLRIWCARSPQKLDMDFFGKGEYIRSMQERELAEVISKVLYPGDGHPEGKALRLRQHYFFTSATIQYVIAKVKREGKDLYRLYDHICIQINDTHPALAIPELMRVLLDVENMDWESVWYICTRVFSYTNHTVLSEALERWPEAMFKELLPRIYQLVVAINEYYCQKLWSFYPGQWEKIGSMAVVGYNELRMANLCVAISGAVNGVSKLHANIIRRGLFKHFFVVEPWKFMGITNGITHRRWLLSANPSLSALIKETIGDGFVRDASKLSALVPFTNDPAFLEQFARVKRENKVRFAQWIKERQGVTINPDAILDVQAKRLHEYKRQMLNALHVLYLYDRMLQDPSFEIEPQVFVFGAKASPGYQLAKQIIRLINTIGAKIAENSRISERLQVVFLENYNVSSAEMLIPAADISEQISTAGKEASGTSNMKFMMNGAITLGTLDGANVEIRDLVGVDNIFLFGLRAEETERLYQNGFYSAGYEYESNPKLRHVLDYLINGTLAPDTPRAFHDIYHSLLFGQSGAMADPYLVLKDFDSYLAAQERVRKTREDKSKWLKMAAMNTAMSGFFSSDRTIAEYNEHIWHLDTPK